MLESIQHFCQRTNLGAAYRYPRLVAGKLAGIFFFFGTICEVSLPRLFGGGTAAITTGLTGIYSFLMIAKKNYDESNPQIREIIQDLEQKHIITSNYQTLKLLQIHQTSTLHFCRKVGFTTMSFINLDDYNDDTLNVLCLELYKNLQTNTTIFEKYAGSCFNFLAEFAGNYLEYMLAKTFWGVQPYNVNEGLSFRNVAFAVVTLVAIYNSYQCYRETKDHYENPPIDTRTKAILLAYRKHNVFAKKANERTALISDDYLYPYYYDPLSPCIN